MEQPEETVSIWHSSVLRLARDRRIAFAAIGALNTAIGTALFIGFQVLFSSLNVGRFDYLASLIAAQITSLLCSFTAQRYLVFRVRGHFWGDFARFATVSTGAFLINLVLLPFCVEVLGWPKIPAQLAVTAVIAVGTYVAHRDFSFRRNPEDSASPDDPQPKEPPR